MREPHPPAAPTRSYADRTVRGAMSDFVPAGFVTIQQAVDLTGGHLFPNEWTGEEIGLLKPRDTSAGEADTSKPDEHKLATPQRLDRAIHYLRSLLSLLKVPAVVIFDNGQSYQVGASVWLSNSAPTIFRTGLEPVNLRQLLADRQSGRGRRRVLLPEARLDAALAGEKKPETAKTAFAGTFKAETDCQKWIAQKAAAGETPASRSALYSEARARFGNKLSQRSFDRAWTAAAPEEWKKPGRKSSRRIETPK